MTRHYCTLLRIRSKFIYAPTTIGDIKRSFDPSIHLSVCLSVNRSTPVHFTAIFTGHTNRKPHADFEPTGQRGHRATGSGRNDNKAVACATSEAFVRWLHRASICPR